MKSRNQIVRRGRIGVPVVAAGLVLAAVAGCDAAYEEDGAGQQPSSAAAAARPDLAWGECPPAAEGASRDERLTCATVEVPLDHDDPDGKKIEVAVSKLPTAKSGKRKGVLVLNPGGPALQGLDTPGAMAPTLPTSVLDNYDLIGFDPRGVGHSAPQTCGLENPSPLGLFPYPAADGSITANVALAKDYAQRCGSNAELKYFTTANTARDLDLVRAALGEEKISYWGQSYGTYLGTVYVSLYPERTERVILEGNVDPTKVWADSAASWGKGMADRFPDAAAVAAGQNAALGLGATVEEVTGNYLALADRLDRTPAPVPGTDQAVSGALLRHVTYGLLLHNDDLQVLVRFWKAVANLAAGAPTEDDGTVLQQVFAPGPVTPGVPPDNQVAMFLALTCGDAESSHDIDSYAARVAADREKWPLTAGMPMGVRACAFWPKPIEKPVTVTDDGPRNTLILQNRRDHATPWDEARGLRDVLGDRAVFVGADNGGHYVYNEGSPCVDDATVKFLSTGELPAEDLECTDVEPK